MTLDPSPVNQGVLDPVVVEGAAPSQPAQRSAGVLARAARSRRGRVGLALTGFLVAVAALGPLVAPHSPTEFVVPALSPPSSQAILGGDELGRDVLSRVLHGGWLLLLMASAATIFGVALGCALGMVAAYRGGATETLIMRTGDVLLAFPQLVFALLLVSVIGPKIWLLVFAVGIAQVPQVARVIRAAALDVARRDFVRAAELFRVSPRRILVREILPNITSVVMVEFGLRLTWSILAFASLSFIGFGLQPPAANWGLMVNENRTGLVANPWAVLAPAALLAILAIGLNTFTDAVARASLRIGDDRGTAHNTGATDDE